VSVRLELGLWGLSMWGDQDTVVVRDMVAQDSEVARDRGFMEPMVRRLGMVVMALLGDGISILELARGRVR